jgi:hypothetical protein
MLDLLWWANIDDMANMGARHNRNNAVNSNGIAVAGVIMKWL